MRVIVIAVGLVVAAVVGVLWLRTKPPLDDAGKRARIESMIVGYHDEIGDVPTVTVGEAVARRDRGDELVFVDAREAEERSVSIIPGAVPLAEVESEPDRFRNATLVTYCTIGYRSALATRRLVEDGLDAFNLEGSLLLWTHDGGELVGPDGPTTEVHVYGPKWDLLPEGYTSVW